MATIGMTGMPVVADTSSMAEKFFGSAMATVMRPLTMDKGSSWLRRHRSSGTMLTTSLSILYSVRSTNGRLMPWARAMAYSRSVFSSMPSVEVGMAGKSPVASLGVAAWRGWLGAISLVLLASKKVDVHGGIPFGPSMLLGAWLGIFAGVPIATLYLQCTGLA